METRFLTLSNELNREAIDRHEIRIISTNLQTNPSSGRTSENSHLIVEITVNDVNDNPPTFQQKNYSVGVSETDNLRKTLLTLYATDPDLDDVVTYYLRIHSILVVGENLEDVKEFAFLVNEATGHLTLNFQPQPGMSGYFEFVVLAQDKVSHTDEAFVKIYLVAEVNRVTFVFLNDANFVRQVDAQQIATIFSNAYEAECIIDDILEKLVNGVAQTRLTDVRVHFVQNNQALEAKNILR